jgi:hypothetical protein
MWSYPNLLPLGAGEVGEIARRVARFRFVRVYGGWWGDVVAEGGADVVARSAHRYVERLHGHRPGGATPFRDRDARRRRHTQDGQSATDAPALRALPRRRVPAGASRTTPLGRVSMLP